MADLNGLTIRGKIFYEIDSLIRDHEVTARPLPEVLYDEDKYSWDLDSEAEAGELEAQLAAINMAAAVSPFLLSVLSDSERTVVYEHVWNGWTFHKISFLFPQRDKEGNPRRGDDGHVMHHDHKWVQRRYIDAIKKMREAAASLPPENRMQTTHHIPLPRQVVSITERVIEDEQGERAGHAARILVRENARKRRAQGTPAG